MPLATRKTRFSEPRLQREEKRKGVRLNSRVPVTIEWEGASGQAFHEKAHTRVVGPYGCLLVLPVEIQVDQAIRVTNLATAHSSDASIVWRGPKQSDGWELGIRLIEPELDFWGLEL
jgi:hypothetical protein